MPVFDYSDVSVCAACVRVSVRPMHVFHFVHKVLESQTSGLGNRMSKQNVSMTRKSASNHNYYIYIYLYVV